jgi:hypothetical protein
MIYKFRLFILGFKDPFREESRRPSCWAPLSQAFQA